MFEEFINRLDKLESDIINISLESDINSIDDILNLISLNPLHDMITNKEIFYNIDIKTLHKIKEPICRLNQMIGLENVKKEIVKHILYYIQNMNDNNDYMHIVISGVPGTGKTELAKCIGDIFSKLGCLSNSTFNKVTRSDLIAGYLGQTAIKTRKVIDDTLGGVLFIDEAYSLGNSKRDDIFAKECIDTLCEALSVHKNELLVIIAGYEEELEECFFKMNRGLHSRFPWRYVLKPYSYKELANMFIRKHNSLTGWSISCTDEELYAWFEFNKELFTNYGRDIDHLCMKVRIAHSFRVFGKESMKQKEINIQDMNDGVKTFINKEKPKNINMMYC